MAYEEPVYVEALTKREQEVLEILSQEGLTNRQLGERFFISEKTVEKHLGNVYQKLGLSRRSEAIIWAKDNLIAK